MQGNRGEKREFKAGASHFLFQLKPEFRLLRWVHSYTQLIDIIQTDDGVSVKNIAASEEDIYQTLLDRWT